MSKRYGKSALRKRRRERERAIVYRAKFERFIEAASRPGARLYIALDVFDMLRSAAPVDPWLHNALFGLALHVDVLLPRGSMVALPRYDPQDLPFLTSVRGLP